MAAPNQPPAASDQTTGEDEEVRRLRAERDAAVAELAKRHRREVRGGMLRRITVTVLVVLVAILVPVTATATWVRHTVLNTDNYVNTVAPIASDPAVTAALARTATDELYAALDPQQVVAEALPPKAAFLAAPISNAFKGFVQGKVNDALNTETFQQIWVQANRVAHEKLLAVLHGDAKAVKTTDGQVVLNLVPLLNSVLGAVQEQASALLGKNMSLPTLTGDELPSAACAKLSAALRRPLPQTCGQIALFPADRLNQAQRAVRAFEHLVVALLIVTPLLAALALWLTRRRRRTLIQMAAGVILGMVVVRRTVMWLQRTLIASGKPENKDARDVIVHTLLNGFFTVSLWVLWIALAVVVVAAVTGPYRWAVRGRSWALSAGSTVVGWTRAGFGRAQGAVGGDWVPAHLDALRFAGVAIAAVLVLLLNVSWVGLLVIAALTAAYLFWLYRVGQVAEVPPGEHPGPPPSAPPRPSP